MKKYSFALVGGLLLFAACTSNNNPNNQAAIDSMANAKANAMQTNMAASNDSMINAVAKQKADSIEMAKHMEAAAERKEGHGRREEHRESAQPVQQQPQTIGNGKPSMTGNQNNGNQNGNSNSGTIGNGKPKM